MCLQSYGHFRLDFIPKCLVKVKRCVCVCFCTLTMFDCSSLQQARVHPNTPSDCVTSCQTFSTVGVTTCWSSLSRVLVFFYILFYSVLFCSIFFCPVIFCSVLLQSILFCSVFFYSILASPSAFTSLVLLQVNAINISTVASSAIVYLY